MRGFDYRKADHAKGVALIICKRLDTKRDLFQACGRVGRYGENCRRYLDTALDGNPIDEVKQTQLNNTLYSLMVCYGMGLDANQKTLDQAFNEKTTKK